MKKYLTRSPNQTKKLGKRLAKSPTFLKRWGMRRKGALVIGLKGNLGGGKTTFLQGFARGLGIREKILSPTFVIVKRFKIKDLRFKNFYHIDCYRINNLKEILDLGLKKIISDPKNIIVIEWADRIKKLIPETGTWVEFELVNKNIRKIMIK